MCPWCIVEVLTCLKYLKQGGYRAKIDQKGPKSTKMVRTRRGLEAEVLRFFAATPARRPANPTFLGHDGRFCSPNMHPNVLPPRSAISRVVRLLPGARFRAAHPPRPHVGSGVHRRGGLGWVKGRRAYEQSPGPIVSRAGTRLRSPCGAATRQAQADSHNRFNTFVKLCQAFFGMPLTSPALRA